jgi:maleate isomerase
MDAATAGQVARSPETAALVPRDGTARFGLIALATDLTSEGDCFRILPRDGTALHVSRVANENPTTPENLRRMAPRLTAAADLLVPGEDLAGIFYSCTAASVVIGDDMVTEAIQAARPGVPVVTPTLAARAAFRALGVGRIAILTPYLIETSEPMAAYFTRHGLEVTRLHCFGLEDDRDMAHIASESILRGAVAVDSPEAEALFLSCTALPAVGVIAAIEQKIGKPVVSSNPAAAWALAGHAGMIERCAPGHGRLFEATPR